MQDAFVGGGKKRINAFISFELDERMMLIERVSNYTRTEIIRKALEEFISKFEEDRIKKELEEGYKANETYYKKMSEEWKFADSI